MERLDAIRVAAKQDMHDALELYTINPYSRVIATDRPATSS